ERRGLVEQQACGELVVSLEPEARALIVAEKLDVCAGLVAMRALRRDDVHEAARMAHARTEVRQRRDAEAEVRVLRPQHRSEVFGIDVAHRSSRLEGFGDERGWRDLVLHDQVLPELDGVERLRRIEIALDGLP